MPRALATLLLMAAPFFAHANETCETLLQNDLRLVDRAATEIMSFDSVDAVEAIVGEMQAFEADVQKMQRPVAHGTATKFLYTILSAGLTPSSAKYISLSDLRLPDGMMTSYGSATRTLRPRFKISSYDITGRDIVTRLAEHNQWLNSAPFSFTRRILFRVMSRLFEISEEDQGWPVILIYDAAKLTDLIQPNKTLPAGLLSQSQLNPEDLKYIFTPAQDAIELAQALWQLSLRHVRVIPMEFLEICDIHAHPTHPFRAWVRKCLP